MEEEGNMASASNKGHYRDQLTRVRPELIKRITGVVLKGLLDKLQAHSPPVINNEEAKEIQQRSSVEQDQVRSLVDVVDKKGNKACEMLLSHLRELDNYLYQDLGLVSPTEKGRDAMEMSSLKQTVQSIFREKFVLISQELETGKKQKLQDIFTDLCIIEGPRGINDEHELSAMCARLDETRTTSANIKTVKLSDIFSDHYVTGQPVKKVLTLGIAGAGKTFAVQKFVLDWAEGTQNQNIHLIFVLPFRELNMHTDKEYSLFDLLKNFYPDCKALTKAFANKNNLVLFVLDGLDESRMQLFQTSISDPTKKASIAELITSLIKGDLLSSALVWVTSRPAAANKKLQDLFDLVTEIQGFSECQREEYFERVIPGKAEEIIAHLKSKRSLFIMCHIPVFCHIAAVVLGGDQGESCLSSKKKALSRKELEQHQGMPKTLTEMYARYCVLQIRRMNEKYFKEDEMCAEDKGALLIKLGKLAFKYLEKDTLIFYKKDLLECEIEVESGALQAGLCTQIFKKENAECGESMFSFVHLSVQEFLAALYMVHMHATGHTNLFITTGMQKFKWCFSKSRFNLYKVCLKKALLSQNGHLDLFVRFLVGLAPLLEPEIKYPLDAILPHLSKDVKDMSITKTVDYIKKQINKTSSPERIINLFHCLNELGDNSMVEEIERYMSSSVEKNLTPVQCSALAYLLIMSAEVLEEFDLKKYLKSDEGLHRMLPVVCISQRVQLNQCHLSKASCEMLASTLQGLHSHLHELEMSHNELQDKGVELLCEGLRVPQCRLGTLRLSGCLISESGCRCLATALTSNPSHLKRLDLSYNHPGESGLKLLSARLEDPHCQLEILNTDNCGQVRLKPGLRKYACDVTLDPNTANRLLYLSEGNRKVTFVDEEQPYPDHPDIFESEYQVLCREGLSGHCYWEAEWSGCGPDIAVAYKSTKRKGLGDDVIMGQNAKSWSLDCSTDSYSAWHNNKRTEIPAPSSHSRRVGVYLDWPAGTLSFYSVSSDTLTHLHTFHSTFTEPLYPGFYVGLGSSVSLCQIK
ncbi:NLR family CARD domain-containing protein 3-like [Engraulis encrasicolus]|uniref:NLR family CARD domain-containing protein 3-like n=1 Tax=Engraulis encrasicolus TaxID=184585 RepID=UPI002FD2744F